MMQETAHILIVEDTAIQTYMLRRMLERAGYSVAAAVNGVEALAAIKKQRPDLILSDVVMPEMDGFRLTEAVKRDAALRAIPIILLTQLSEVEDILRGLECGADDYMLKPWDEAVLLPKIRAWLQAAPPAAEEAPLPFAMGERRFAITAPRPRILNLLVSTYQNAIAINFNLMASRRELEEANDKLATSLQTLEASQKELRISEHQLHSIVAVVPDIIYRIDSDGHFVFLNEAVTPMLGYQPAELIGRHYSVLMDPPQAAAVTRTTVLANQAGKGAGQGDTPKLFDERRTAQRITTGLEVMLHPKGSAAIAGEVIPLDCEVNATGIYDAETTDPAKQLLGTVGVIRDVSERKVMENRLRLQAEIVHNMGESVYLIRASDGVIVETNPKFDALFGYAPGELLGQPVSLVNAPAHKDAAETAREIMAGLNETGEWHGEVENIRKDGSRFWCNANVSTFDHPKFGKVWISVHNDISRRKAAERMKDEIIGTVSHELRTPLASLRGFAELMLARDYPPQKQREFLTIIDQESRRLGRLIDQFLDLQRIESGRQTYQMEALAFLPLLQEAVALFSKTNERHRFRIEAGPALPAVRGDREKLTQVLENLLSNAVKFSPAGGDILVAARARDGEMEVRVTDHGIGIPPEALPQLFQKFYRVEQPKALRQPGTGLGLALVKEIVQAHGGQVGVDSEPGQGSTFYFTLPVASQEP